MFKLVYINSNIKTKRERLEVKIGVGRVRVKEVWRAWADVEREGLGNG